QASAWRTKGNATWAVPARAQRGALRSRAQGAPMSNIQRRDGFNHPVPSEITPQSVYEGRRALLRGLAAGAGGAALAAWAGRSALAATPQRPGKLAALAGVPSKVAGAVTMEKLTSYEDATTYNNFYEFGTDKADPAREAGALKIDPWSVAVEGL